jgi:major membrane immunogen (membrane-anchored lipoprotein)
MTRMVAALAALLLAAALSGCGGSDVTSGTVTGKEYDKPKTTCKTTTDRKTKKKTRTCTTKQGHWEIDLRDSHGNMGEVKVDQSTYDRMQVGQHYP